MRSDIAVESGRKRWESGKTLLSELKRHLKEKGIRMREIYFDKGFEANV